MSTKIPPSVTPGALGRGGGGGGGHPRLNAGTRLHAPWNAGTRRAHDEAHDATNDMTTKTRPPSRHDHHDASPGDGVPVFAVMMALGSARSFLRAPSLLACVVASASSSNPSSGTLPLLLTRSLRRRFIQKYRSTCVHSQFWSRGHPPPPLPLLLRRPPQCSRCRAWNVSSIDWGG